MTEHTIHTVKIENISATDAIALKQELVYTYNLSDGHDFIWSWYPEVLDVLDDYSYFVTSPRRMEIRFADQANATFFQLKYAPR